MNTTWSWPIVLFKKKSGIWLRCWPACRYYSLIPYTLRYMAKSLWTGFTGNYFNNWFNVFLIAKSNILLTVSSSNVSNGAISCFNFSYVLGNKMYLWICNCGLSTIRHFKIFLLTYTLSGKTIKTKGSFST